MTEPDCDCCSTPVQWLERHGEGYATNPALRDLLAARSSTDEMDVAAAVAAHIRAAGDHTRGGDLVMGCTIPPSEGGTDGYAWHYAPDLSEPPPGRCPA